MALIYSYSLCEPYQTFYNGGLTAGTVQADSVRVQVPAASGDPWAAGGSNYLLGGMKRADLAMDWSWAPYVQGSIVLARPSAATLTAIDPRSTGQRVTFTLRRSVFDTATGVTTTTDQYWNLQLRGFSLDYAADELTLTVTSDETLLQDYARGTTYQRVISSPEDVVFTVDELTSPAVMKITGYDLNVVGVTLTSTADTLWTPGSSLWDYLAGLIEGGGKLWSDEKGILHLTSPNYVWDSTVRTLTDAAQIINVVSEISRDNPAWATMVVLTYQGNSPPVIVYDTQAGGAGPNRKALNVSRAGKRPNSGNAATRLAASAAGRGQTIIVTAVADIVARPQQTWTVTYAGETHTGKLRAVSFNIFDGTMQLTIDL